MSVSANAEQLAEPWQSNISVVDMKLVTNVPLVGMIEQAPKYGTPPYVTPKERQLNLKALEQSFNAVSLRVLVQAEKVIQDKNRETLKNRIDQLEEHLGTPYVFSGSTPRGWDCSGLVMWFYADLGVELEHSARSQARTGTITDNPSPGDIVAFKYRNGSSAYHVGIYLAPNKMLHSGGGRGDRTEVASIDAFGGNYSEVVYVKILDT